MSVLLASFLSTLFQDTTASTVSFPVVALTISSLLALFILTSHMDNAFVKCHKTGQFLKQQRAYQYWGKTGGMRCVKKLISAPY